MATPGKALTKPLTARQERFVATYLVSLNASEAYRDAYGCTPKAAEACGSRLLGNAKVAAAIATAQAKRSERTEITQDYVIGSAREVVDRCLQKAPVMVRDGNRWVQAVDDEGRAVWQFDARGAVAGLALLAKHVGLGERPNLNINFDFEKLSDAQLEHLAGGGSLANLPR